jgi:hypothetical protein
MRRVRVGLMINGTECFYQREEEIRDAKNGKWTTRPYFVDSKRQAATMNEDVGLVLVQRLRSLRQDPWLEDVSNLRRIDLGQQHVQESGTDDRTAVRATLDETNWYVVRPTCRPEGRKWFLKIDVPGLPEPYVSYADDPIGVLERAQELNYLRFAERHELPQPQQAPVTQTTNGWRNRPGDRS